MKSIKYFRKEKMCFPLNLTTFLNISKTPRKFFLNLTMENGEGPYVVLHFIIARRWINTWYNYYDDNLAIVFVT
jgi:hypothetical protein